VNDRKICFISCVNNSVQYFRAVQYAKRLQVPEGFQVEFVEIRDAESLTSGYNRAMKMTDAKYKVYMHQDVYILHTGFLLDTIRLFRQHPKLGMLGMAGAGRIPPHGVWYEAALRYGKVYGINANGLFNVNFLDFEGEYQSVQAIDGLLMMTQYDMPWRDQWFRGWHFYDVSQSCEFLQAGYDVGVPAQAAAWCIHDCVLDFDGYEENRQIFLKHYGRLLEGGAHASAGSRAKGKGGEPAALPTDPRKICFITCVNNPAQYEVSKRHMAMLRVPPGFTVDFVAVTDAASMTSGYNRAMRQTNAKYKIYLHQDVFILHRELLAELIRLFERYPRLGLVGMIGIGSPLPEDAIWVKSRFSFGKLFGLEAPPSQKLMALQFLDIRSDYQSVKVVDGMLMATQYDIPWREDLFRGWHFYDTSQSMEFLKAGYEVGVARQSSPWTIHACHPNPMIGYEDDRLRFVKEYAAWIKAK
jgi:GT2 family glycosyltransferase